MKKILIMATVLVTVGLTIGNYSLTRANAINIKSSWKTLADTAIVKLPYLKGKLDPDNVNKSLADVFKVGDPIQIKLGYIGLNKSWEFTEFTGFVRRVVPTVPMVLECEDGTFLLRRTNLEKTWRNTTLKEVVQYIVDQTNEQSGSTTKITMSGKLPNVNFDKFTIDNINAAVSLQELKDTFKFAAYFRGTELFVGIAFTDLQGKVTYNFAWNVIPPPNLTYRKEEDVIIRLKAIGVKADNTQITVTVGPASGELITQVYYDVTDKDSLQQMAEADLKRMRFEGYEGHINTKLVPFAQHSMVATLIDPEFQDKGGDYIIDEVETSYDASSGIERKITIGKRV